MTWSTELSQVASTFSPFVGPIEPITETGEEIQRYLEQAEVPALLPALAYATGDLSLLRNELRPDPLRIATASGGLTDEQRAAVRELALEALIRFRDNGSTVSPPPTEDTLLKIMEFTVGSDDMSAYLPLLEEELAVLADDRRGPDWHAGGWGFRVVIVGAGMSGLVCARRMKQAGIPFVVIEKNADVGGTWLENSYPGCRVDAPNHSYSYSFAQRHDWPFHYSTQDVLLNYFQRCADAFGLRDHVRFNTEVLSANWSDTEHRWTVRVRTTDGAEESIEANAVVSAVGQLNRPLYPDIEGRDSFSGPSFHSAKWDHEIDLRGKRVAVIGTGASAVQLVPEIAKVVGELLVFQRTPPWFISTPDFHDEVSAGQIWLYGHLPSYSEWNRFWLFWQAGDGALDNVRVDPDYATHGDAVSDKNAFMRTLQTNYITAQFADRPDLLPHVIPDYPPGAKRMLRDNGSWARALKSENTQLITDGIREITPSGIVTRDGVAREVDVIIYSTGFHASKFLTPMSVTGRGGIDLHEKWDGDARAYLGLTVPGFPNLFCLYGPNTNIVVNGSIVFFSECGVRYLLGCLKLLRDGKHQAMDARKDVHDEFNEAVDAENRRMAWGWSEVNSWYKNDRGRVAQNWPFPLLDYWQRTLAPNPQDYEFEE